MYLSIAVVVVVILGENLGFSGEIILHRELHYSLRIMRITFTLRNRLVAFMNA